MPRGYITESRVLVPNQKLRENFIRLRDAGEISASEVARRMGWIVGKDNKPDNRRVRRTLGLVPANSHGIQRFQTMMNEQTARSIADALGIDPMELGF